jgi:hypothetical protein
VLAVDQQRAGRADRDLRHAGEVLDVPGQGPRVERELTDVLQVDAGLLTEELTAHPRRVDGIVVVPVTRHALAVGSPIHCHHHSSR